MPLQPLLPVRLAAQGPAQTTDRRNRLVGMMCSWHYIVGHRQAGRTTKVVQAPQSLKPDSKNGRQLFTHHVRQRPAEGAMGPLASETGLPNGGSQEPAHSGLLTRSQLALTSLCSQGWPDPPATTCQALRLQMGATTPGLSGAGDLIQAG